MKVYNLLTASLIPAACALLSLTACDDDVNPIGGSIFDQQVSVYVDSSAYRLQANTIPAKVIDARSSNNLLGHISVPEYGELSASFVSRILSASAMEIPDSITVNQVDSMRVVFEVPRPNVVGDSLAPQQLTIYRLDRQLPADIKSDFNPTGYYDPSRPVAKTNYTLSGIALSDSAFRALKVLPISATLPQAWAKDVFKAYRDNPSIFQWPADLQKVFPGIYVEPTFGRGCIASIQAARFYTYWHHTITRTIIEDSVAKKVPVLMKDSVCLLSSAPEVLASNNLSYTPSQNILNAVAQGDKIITTPLGYHVEFRFPGKQLLESYYTSSKELSIINNLALGIPASAVDNDYDIGVAPNMLMIRSSEIEDFFANGKVPDNKTSFYSAYSATAGRYYFNQLRQYLVDLNSVYNKVSDEEFEKLCEFTLIPVNITTEAVPNSDGSTTTYVTGCTPYLARPTMTRLDTDHALVVFTFTHQYID